MEFHRSEDTRGWAPRRNESLTFRTVGRDPQTLKHFVNEVVACHERRVGRSCLFVHNEGWIQVAGYTPRSLESIILNPGEKEHLILDVEAFKASRKRYFALGIPYHRGYLLHGPPGTGKTSLVSAVADKFGMSIYAVNLNEFNDRSLMMGINDAPPDSVILFEDIDCMSSGKARTMSCEETTRPPFAREAKSEVLNALGVTLSGLLNVLDGFGAPDNVLFIMTSNRIEALDPALLRPGRIDYRLYLGEASEQQKMELYSRFFPSSSGTGALEFVQAHRSAATMAEFQGLLLGLEQNHSVEEAIAF